MVLKADLIPEAKFLIPTLQADRVFNSFSSDA
jgi:hypothetical protein